LVHWHKKELAEQVAPDRMPDLLYVGIKRNGEAALQIPRGGRSPCTPPVRERQGGSFFLWRARAAKVGQDSIGVDGVREVIDRCVSGQIDAVYQLGHPAGFQNQIYVGETYFCRPLHDPAGELSTLKQLVVSYPPQMRRALVDKHPFDAQFEIEFAWTRRYCLREPAPRAQPPS